LGFLLVAALSIIENTREAVQTRRAKLEKKKEEALKNGKSPNRNRMLARNQGIVDEP